MDFLPIFLNIRDRKCVIVGGGEVAYRKATLLIRAGGSLHIVAERLESELAKLCQDNESQILGISEQSFSKEHLKDALLVIAATDSRSVNAEISAAATAANIPVNVVDQPDLCTFIMPSIVDRTPIVVAISSGGSSPVLTRQIKELNELMLPTRINRLAEILASYRGRVKDGVTDFEDRIRFWEDVLDSDIPELVYSGNDEQATLELDKRLAARQPARVGEVYLVGAGPGDPDLLTLRALRLMHKADVVLYDRLVSPEILQKVRPDAQKIHVGKERSHHSVEQETINKMLVRFAKEGNRVLRLKGGDPFIFGRGGEELDSLSHAGIPFQVVPGITAASGCAAYAGIPLTHRDHSQSVRFLPGHLKEGSHDLDWEALVKEQQTLVFYMGLVGLPKICQQLLAHGMDEATPMAVIQQGTTARQRVLTGNLASMPAKVEQAGLKAPTLIIIGEVVTLREQLSWFEDSNQD